MFLQEELIEKEEKVKDVPEPQRDFLCLKRENSIERGVPSFYAPGSNDRGAYCFCFVCLSVCLSTLTFAITFEP